MAKFPIQARKEFIQYRCDECGAVNDSHRMQSGGHGGPAAVCRDCGSPTLRRDLVPELSELIAEGIPLSPAADYWAVEIKGYSQTEWAEKRGTTQQAVSKNINGAKERI